MALGFANSGERPCPCGSGDSLLQCCGPLHQGRLKAETAEQLMRSRYSAYALSEVDYLIATHPDAASAAAERRRELQASCRKTRWHGLKVLASEAGCSDDLEGTVRFEAVFSAGGQRHVLKEHSLFRRRNGVATGEWLYIRPLD